MDTIEDEAAKIAAAHFRDGYNCAENVLMAMQYGTWKRGRISSQPLEQTGIGLRGVITGRIIAINVEVPGLRSWSEISSNENVLCMHCIQSIT